MASATFGKLSVEKNEYSINWGDPLDVGTYKAVIKPSSDSDFEGSKEVEYKVSGISLDGATVTFNPEKPIYDGTSQKPDVTVKVKIDDKDIVLNEKQIMN